MAKLARALLALLLAGAGSRAWYDLRAFHAGRLSLHDAEPLSRLEEAARLDPDGPEPQLRLGLLHRDLIELRDLPKAQAYLERAVELNPYASSYRLELGRLYEVAGDSAGAETAFLEAIGLNPRSGGNHFVLAEFYLRTDRYRAALDHLGLALEADTGLLSAALALLNRVRATLPEIERVWPEDRVSRLQLLRYIAGRRESGGDAGDLVETARREWRRISTSLPALPRREGAFYVDFLIGQGLYGEARREWIALNRINGYQDRAFALGRNELWNGNFELPLAQCGLGWRLSESAEYSVTRLEATGAGSSPSLRLDFSGDRNPDLREARQEVLVDAGAIYSASFEARSEGINTTQGIFLQVLTPATGTVLSQSDQIHGSTPWTEYELQVDVPENHRVISILFRREKSEANDPLLEGRFWLRAVRLERQAR